MSITELAIKRPSLIIVIFSILGVLGWVSFKQLKYELLPKMTPPVISVTTIYPGASPQEIENVITRKVEDAMSVLEKVKSIRGISQEGVSIVICEFANDANVDQLVQDANRRLGEVYPSLPEGTKSPIVSKFALDEIPILRMGVTSNVEDKEFFTQFKNHIMPRLTGITGVGQVVMIGGVQREVKVNVNQEKLQAYGIPLLQVAQVIKSANMDFPTGKVKDKDGEYTVRISGKLDAVDQLSSIIIGKSRSGGDILLSDIADVTDGEKDMAQLTRINLKSSIGLILQKSTDANAVEVSKTVRAELQKLEEDYKNINLKFDVAVDGSTFTIEAADGVIHDLYIAIFLVALVMLLFLHSLRNSLIVMVAIPASLLSTFIGMYVLGFSLNLMTLLALSLVIGILVDDSIVVLENIYRHLEMGKDRVKASLDGRSEIGFTALSITLVDVVVFLPLGFQTGIIGNIMREFSLVVVISTLMSLFVSFTVTPVLASRFSKLEHLNPKSAFGFIAIQFEKFYTWLEKEYAKLLHWALHHKAIVMIATVVLLLSTGSFFALGLIGSEFVKQADRGEFSVSLEYPSAITVEENNLLTQKIEQDILKLPEVFKGITQVGASNDGFLSQSSNNLSEITISLTPREQRSKTTDQVGYEIKQMVRNKYPGVQVRVNPIGLFGTANQTPIQLIVKGKTYDEVYVAAEHIQKIVQNTPGSADVRLSADRGKPELKVELERDKMTTLGLSVAEVGATLRTALAGDDESKFRQAGDEFDIRIQLDKYDRNKTENLGEMMFMNRQGKQIKLKQFAKISRSTGPSKLERKGRMPAIVVMSQAVGVPTGDLGNHIEKAINEDKLKKGSPIGPNIIVEYDGELKNQRESSGSMGTALLISIIFVYLIMVALYDSYVYPFVVLFSLPVAVIGAMLALALTLNNMGIFTMLGVIMLMGLVAKNAILLVDFTNQIRKEKGLGVYEALLEASPARLRPILMTTLAMVFGMFPIALAAGAGSEWKAGLAWALIGGLSSSMLLTLVVVPIGYVMMTRMLHFVEKITGLKIEPVQLPFDNHTPLFPPTVEEETTKEHNTVVHVN